MSRITVQDLNKVQFYQVPKAFHHNPKYITMNSDSKLAYALLRDLLELSVKNGWVNANGEIYVKLSRKKLMIRLNIKGTQKITKIMQELKDNGLIEEEQIGLNKCNEIYICTPEDLSELYDDSDLLDLTETEKKHEQSIENKGVLKIKTPRKVSKINGSLKIKTPEIRKSNFKAFENQTHTNTKYTKTNFNTSSSKEALIYLFENNICKLGKITKIKFLNIIENESIEYLKAVIEYQSNINTRSYAGFEKGFKNFESNNIHTVEDLKIFLENYNKNKSKKTYKKKEKKLLFNDFKQREYNYDILEKKLLGWTDEEISKHFNLSLEEVEKLSEGSISC